MNKLIYLFFVFLVPTGVFADEPPTWEAFAVVSNNEKFLAAVSSVKGDSILEPYYRKWELTIYDLSHDTIEIWRKEYFFDGYPGGWLSNDGKVFVRVNSWLDFEMPPNQVFIYTP